MSASVKAYFALKMIGDSVDAEHMRRAREAIRARGGAARANVFTRTLLALYGQISWRAVPMMPAEVMLLPKWFPFHLDKISYWSRTVIVPLLVLLALKPRAKNAKGVRIDELFLAPPDQARLTPRAPHQNNFWFAFFRGVDHAAARDRAAAQAPADAPARDQGRRGLHHRAPQRRGRHRRDLPGDGQQRADVRRARLSGRPSACDHRAAFGREAPGGERARGLLPAVRVAGVGHRPRLPCDARGRRRARGGAGQQGPRMAQDASRSSTSKATGRRRGPTCGRAAGRSSTTTRTIPTSTTPRWWRWRWIARRTCRARPPTASRSRGRANGSSACRARTAAGARSTPTTTTTISTTFRSPTMARCSILRPRTSARAACRCWRSSATCAKNDPRMAQAVDYLLKSQHPEGSWYGRWGMNYIYGTWSVLCALNAAGVDHQAPRGPQGGRLAGEDPEHRRRLGRGRIELQARLQGLRAGALDAVADRLGACSA